MPAPPTPQPAPEALRPGPAEPASAAPRPPERRRARRRGSVRGLAGLAVAALIWSWKPLLGAVAAGLAVVMLVVALAAPGTLYPRLESGLAAFARAVGFAVSSVTLGLLYFAVFVPLGVLLRGTGRLRIDLSRAPEAPTYWRPADAGLPEERRHERQF